MMNVEHKEQFQQDLLTWYDANARILPWREDPSAYRVWVSEIMLQQTRVEAVKPYFERFLEALPDLQSLAVADDDLLGKLWEGLGYYRRVKNMKKAAYLCMQHYQGKLPSCYTELLKLPGIGAYSAGAIASIAYREQVPAVDGNVLRVFSRLMADYTDILKEQTKKKYQVIVKDWMSKKRPDAFNQAIMEIGALICVPNTVPKCHQCPLQTHCEAFAAGIQMELPVKTKKKQRTIEEKQIDILLCGQEILLHKRKDEGLLAGLYEFMTFDDRLEEQAFLSQYKIKQTIEIRQSKHIFTHKEWHMQGRLILVEQKIEGLWVTWKQLEEQYAIPTAFKVYKEAVMTWLQS